MSKLDKDLERARTEYRPECGDRWVEGVVYSNPACLSDVASSRHDGNEFNIVMRIYGPKASYYKNKNSVPVGSILPLN